MGEKWETKVKKLALAYHTGWQYQPGSAEPGSVLTDLFLLMERENQIRYGKIWEKHEQRFLGAVQEGHREGRRLLTALSVKARGKMDGAWLAEGTEFYTVPGEGGLVRFCTLSPLRLTAAKLCYAIYRDGFFAWLSYAGEDGMPIKLFLPEGEELARPCFSWDFPGLCDGRETFRFTVKFREISKNMPELTGEWSIRCGETVVPVRSEMGETADAVITLTGEGGAFGNPPSPHPYELCFTAGGELGAAWAAALCGGIVLEEEASCFAPKFCLTGEGACGAACVMPFGRAPCEASCCYFVCDRAAGVGGQVTLRFLERYEKEEKLPPPPPAGSAKLYKKYPWMQPDREVSEWKPGETVWEYFNGDFWCALPGSGAWGTGCHPERAGMREYHFQRPDDMRGCVVEGREHYYLRLRLARVDNACAAYYNKYIPVLENICFAVEGRQITPSGSRLCPREWAGEKKMYLGFDREVTEEQRWYTGKEVRSFLREQIKGWGSRFGREAFWVELSSGEPEIFDGFFQNYVEIRQIPPDGDAPEESRYIAAGSLFYAETEEFGVLEAVSLSDAACGTKVGQNSGEIQMGGQEARPHRAEGNYFSHCGRIVSQADLRLMVEEKYPQLSVDSCAFSEDRKEFIVAVRGEAGAEKLLPELEEWLAERLSEVGGIWFQGASVKCGLV